MGLSSVFFRFLEMISSWPMPLGVVDRGRLDDFPDFVRFSGKDFS